MTVYGSSQGWFGVDLDGTLAHYDGWRGPHHIGRPIPRMVARIQKHLAAGERVKVFTARVSNFDPRVDAAALTEMVGVIEDWCLAYIGEVLEVTNVKDYGMIWLYDDRARQVVLNEGLIVGEDA